MNGGWGLRIVLRFKDISGQNDTGTIQLFLFVPFIL